MDVKWTERGLSDIQFYQKNDRKKALKVRQLIDDILLNGLDKGIGKPERLKHGLSGVYSRHIDKKDRLLYYIDNVDGKDVLVIMACRNHYGDK